MEPSVVSFKYLLDDFCINFICLKANAFDSLKKNKIIALKHWKRGESVTAIKKAVVANPGTRCFQISEANTIGKTIKSSAINTRKKLLKIL